MRETSIDAYHEIKEKGLLSKRRFMVYEVIHHNGPMTQGECCAFHFPHYPKPSITPRFAELERRGVIECVGTRPCRVTGHMGMVWELTKNLPVDPKNKVKVKCQHCDGKGYTEGLT